jgi:hypothetical protein
LRSQSDKFELFLLLLIGCALLLISYAYLQTRAGLARQYAVPLEPIELPEDPQAVVEGERLARIRGCFWCHGEKLQGRQYFVNANRGVIYYSPNLRARPGLQPGRVQSCGSTWCAGRRHECPARHAFIRAL